MSVVFWICGFVLLWYYASLPVCIALFLILWANNLQNKINKDEKSRKFP